MQETSTLQQVSFAQTQETSKPDQRNKKYDKPHMIIPDADMAWALEQRPPVFKLWAECWRSDPYGSRWMPLNTTLGRENFKKAKRPLIDSGLFLFENRLTVVNGKRIYEWWIKNLHGCRSVYWKFKGVEIGIDDAGVGNAPSDQSTKSGAGNTEPGAGNTEPGAGNTEPGAGNTEPAPGNTEPGAGNTEVGTHNTAQPYPNALAERVSKALINSSVTSHKHFINLSRSERERFLKFCLEKIAALRATKFEIHTDYGWIASHFEQYWKEFKISEAIKEATKDQEPSNKEKQQKILAIRKAAKEFRERNRNPVLDQTHSPAPQNEAAQPPKTESLGNLPDEQKEDAEEPKTAAKGFGGIDKEFSKRMKAQSKEREALRQAAADPRLSKNKQFKNQQSKHHDEQQRQQPDDDLPPSSSNRS